MVDKKPWHNSTTIWGALLAVGAALAGSLGAIVDPGTPNELANMMVHPLAAIGGLVAIYGRLSATDLIS